MNVAVIYAHPYEKSFNAAILAKTIETLKKSGHDVDLIDLYVDHFNPVLTKADLAQYSNGGFIDPMVEDYQTRLKAAAHIVFIFPCWWAVMPAILKGFIDKVFLRGFAFDPSGRFPKGLMKWIKGATVISTMETPQPFYKLLMKQPIKHMFVRGTLKFSGIKKVLWLNHGMVNSGGAPKRDLFLTKVETALKKI